MRTLGVIALAGVGVSVVCLGLAHAIDPSVNRNWGDGFGFMYRGCSAPAGDSADITRELQWNGDDTVTINVPATIHYRPDNGPVLRASGPNAVMSHLRVRDGRVELDCRMYGTDRELDLVLPGRAFDSFTLNGTGHLVLENLKQTQLNISLRGDADVRATGVADDLTLTIAGSGDADMGQLAVQSSRVRIAGSGKAALAPRDSADIFIAGDGEIRFLEQPRHLQTHIAGSGRIINAPTQGL
jgi:hypothetical protein